MGYMQAQRREKLYIALLIIALLVTMLVATSVGSIHIAVTDVFKVIANHIPGVSFDVSHVKASSVFIIEHVRLPRILLSALVGGVLAVVGTSFQAIFKNPMADPYVMGVSSGAAFGATVATLLGLSGVAFGFGYVSLAAFAGGLTTAFIVYSLAKTGPKVSTTGILLAGIVMSSILSSMISLMMMFNQDEIGNIVNWTFGSFNASTWTEVKVVLLPLGIGIIVLMTFARELNAMVLGEEQATNLGVNVQRFKQITLVISAFLAAFAVSISGIIGFVGLIVPHLFRMIFGANHKILLPVSLVGGALFLLICDTIARTAITGIEIPVGIITSVFGGPFFLYLLRKSKQVK